MKQVLVFLLTGLGLCAVAAEDAAMQRCRELRDAAARLACYDAIPLAGALATPAPIPAAAATPAASFGLESRPSPSASAPVTSIESTIDGRFDGWLPRGQLRLTNGQVWEVADGTQAAYNLSNPKVKITRGVSSSFFMTIEGVAQTPRVRRLK